MIQQDKDTPDIIDRLLSGFDAPEFLSFVRSLLEYKPAAKVKVKYKKYQNEKA
ncbi:hypothetical protein [Dysgonomonas reticulitermitis]